MKTLLQAGDIAQMKSLLVAFILLATHSMPSLAANLQGEGIRATMLWEERWFGSFLGKNCSAKHAKSSYEVFYTVKKQPQKLGHSCATGSTISRSVTTFDAVVPKLAVFAHGSIDGGVRAEIHDGEAGQGCDLTEDDLRSRSKKLLSGAKGLLNFQKSLATEAPPDSKTTEYAVRSIEYWAEKQGIAPIGSIEVGHLLPDDPFIVVRFSPSKVMLLVRPKAEDVESADFCGQLFEPVRFSGRGAHPARLEYSSPRFADRTTRIALRR